MRWLWAVSSWTAILKAGDGPGVAEVGTVVDEPMMRRALAFAAIFG